jgi:hypothetical protein
MRRAIGFAVALAALAGLPACGEDEDHVNRDRPAASLNITAAIIDGRINVSPRSIGAGPLRLIVTNQTDSAQELTFETDEVGGSSGGITQSTEPIDPSGTATLEVDVREGDYAISAADDAIRPAAVKVGARRPSAQDQLLLP